MSNPQICRMLVAGTHRGVQMWRAKVPYVLSENCSTRGHSAHAEAITFSGSATWAREDLPLVAQPGKGGGVHAVALWTDKAGEGHWVWIHDGHLTWLDVPADAQVSFAVTSGTRMYPRFAPTRALTGPGSLAAALGFGTHSAKPFLGYPVLVTVDALAGVARHGATTLERWWGPGMTWAGDAVTLEPAVLGRWLLDGVGPRDDARTGLWEPWAWDALAAYVADPTVRSGDVARAVLQGASARGGVVAAGDLATLATITAPAADVVATARGLAAHGLDPSALAAALVGILTHV